MEFHPDRNDGCEQKAKAFKNATEAYSTLSNKTQRNAYDRELSSRYHPNYEYGHVHYQKQTVDQRTAHYRKVYAPRPPPGFKIFDHEKHQRMHYGDGIMEEEIERMRLRAQKAGSFNLEYQSPLGKGFKLNIGSTSTKTNHRWKKDLKRTRSDGVEFESAYMNVSEFAEPTRAVLAKDIVLKRMNARRNKRERNHLRKKNHVKSSEQGTFGPGSSFQTNQTDANGCVLM